MTKSDDAEKEVVVQVEQLTDTQGNNESDKTENDVGVRDEKQDAKDEESDEVLDTISLPSIVEGIEERYEERTTK